MEKAEYLEIKKQLSFDKPLWVTLVMIVADLALLAFAIHLLTLEGTLFFLTSQVLLALFYFHNFALLHEAGHGNLHQARWVNTLLGHYFSIFCFIPYFAWKHIHQRHHVWAGSINKDPTMRILEKIKKIAKIPQLYATTWRIWVPLPAAAQHLMFWFYPRRIHREEGNTPAFYRSLFSVLFLASSYFALYYFLPDWLTLSNLGLSIFLYFVLTETINLPHHTNVPHFYSTPDQEKLPLWEQHITTRSCHYWGFLSELVALNFNLHVEHHFYPNLPWYRLKKVRDLIKPCLQGEYMEVGDFNWCIENRKIPLADVILPDLPHPLLLHHSADKI